MVFFLYTGIQLPPRMSIDTLADSREPSFDQKSRRFTYSEVVQMTNNFQKVLGKGGFGVVYYGTVNGSEQVAVKVLSQFSTQGYKEFKAEVFLVLRNTKLYDMRLHQNVNLWVSLSSSNECLRFFFLLEFTIQIWLGLSGIATKVITSPSSTSFCPMET